MLKSIWRWLTTPHHSAILFRRTKDTPERDFLQEHYDDLATPAQHMQELARRNIGLMSEMKG